MSFRASDVERTVGDQIIFFDFFRWEQIRFVKSSPCDKGGNVLS